MVNKTERLEETVCFRVTRAQAEQIDKLCAKMERKRADVIRRVFLKGLTAEQRSGKEKAS